MSKTEVSRAELITVIKDFIEMGLVENIVSMFKADTSLYALSGDLLDDERFAVRLGVAVLFEYLVEQRPAEVDRAVPSLAALVSHREAYVRGEAVNVLAIINTPGSRAALAAFAADPDPQVREVVADVTDGQPESG